VVIAVQKRTSILRLDFVGPVLSCPGLSQTSPSISRQGSEPVETLAPRTRRMRYDQSYKSGGHTQPPGKLCDLVQWWPRQKKPGEAAIFHDSVTSILIFLLSSRPDGPSLLRQSSQDELVERGGCVCVCISHVVQSRVCLNSAAVRCHLPVLLIPTTIPGTLCRIRLVSLPSTSSFLSRAPVRASSTSCSGLLHLRSPVYRVPRTT